MVGVLVTGFLAFQGWMMYISDVEEQQYETVAQFDQVEIRYYPPALMATVEQKRSPGQQTANSGFMTLAGYIFGDNSTGQEFAMTAPVHMNEQDSMSTMSFVLPSHVQESDLPDPNNPAVQLHRSEEEYVAAIQYGGYRSKESEAKYRQVLLDVLEQQGIQHYGDFRNLGYDPPSKVVDRRNEVIVSIDISTVP